METLIEHLDQRDWFRLLERVKRLTLIAGTGDLPANSLSGVRSDRLFLALAVRLPKEESNRAIYSRFKEYRGTDPKIFDLVCDAAIRLSFEEPKQWEHTIELIRRAYLIDVSTSEIHRLGRPDLKIPEKIAKQICRSAETFPVALVYYAQIALQSAIGANIGKPVGELALRDAWFAAQ